MDYTQKYDHHGDMTIADLKKAGETITDNMSVGELMAIASILMYGEDIDD